MIVLFTDFGLTGPYTGQVKSVLAQGAPGVPVIDLFADAPSRDPRAAAYLLAAYVDEFPQSSVFLCVVDPGVGTDRRPLIVQADGRFFVGPDNGLFEIVIRRSRQPLQWWPIRWRPERLSATFHARDLFAPTAVHLATGGAPTEPPANGPETGSIRRPDWRDDHAAVIYIDVYGNAMTGVRSAIVSPEAIVRCGGRALRHAVTFASRPAGEAFWFENANGLVEVAVNLGSAAETLGLAIGSPIAVGQLGDQ